MSKNRVYLVIQHQSDSPEYDKNVVYTCATREVAEYAASQLNKEYHENVILDEDNQFVEVINYDYDYHYYEVESYAIENSIEELKRDYNL